MTEEEKRNMRDLLKQAIPPLREPELQHDLWPRMLRRLDRQPAWQRWVDCALAALALSWLAAFPELIPGLLMQL